MAIATYEGMVLMHNAEAIEQLLVDGFRAVSGIWDTKAEYRAEKLAAALAEGDSYVLRFFPNGGRPLTTPVVINAANWRAGYTLYRGSPSRFDEGLKMAAEELDKTLYLMSLNKEFVEGSTEGNTVVKTVTVGSASPFSWGSLQGW